MESSADQFELLSEADTHAFAERLARCLCAPLVLAFSGDLGAGKTTLVRAMLRALGVTGTIKSPTFSLLESYALPHQAWSVHHFDLYRIDDPVELERIGFRDYFTTTAVCCIEWPERAERIPTDVHFSLRVQNTHRWLEAVAVTTAGLHVLASLRHAH